MVIGGVWWVLVIGSGLGLAGEPEAGLAIDGTKLRAHVEFLASPEMAGRGSAESRRKAATYLVDQFRELRLAPAFPDESFEQEIPGPKNAQGVSLGKGWNVAAVLAGSDPVLKEELIVLGAHFDHLGERNGAIFAGADDNASSVAMMLEVARVLTHSKLRPARSVVFVGFDLEEHMLWGSQWFAAHPPWPMTRVKLFITAEMMGRTLGDLPLPVFVLGAERAEGLRAWVDAAAPYRDAPESGFDKKTSGVPLKLAHLGVDLIGTRSDYGPFRDRKIPFVFFSGGEHPDYHTPRDVPDKIDYSRLSQASEAIGRLVRRAAGRERLPVWTESPASDVSEVATIVEITTLVLERDDARRAAGGEGKLNAFQRYLVESTRQTAQKIVARGKLLPDERPWLIRSAQTLLLSVF